MPVSHPWLLDGVLLSIDVLIKPLNTIKWYEHASDNKLSDLLTYWLNQTASSLFLFASEKGDDPDGSSDIVEHTAAVDGYQYARDWANFVLPYQLADISRCK